IGDILRTPPLVRPLTRRHPEAKLVYVTKRAMAPLVSDNPHLAEVVSLEAGEPIRHFARVLRGLGPTHGLDLHASLRSAALRLQVHCRWSSYRKRKLGRALLISTKLDVYRTHVPVSERYFEAARRRDARPDGEPPEFCLGKGAQDRAAQWLGDRALAGARLAALAPGAAHATKRWPIAHWSALAEELRAAGYKSVVVGGPEDRGLAEQLMRSGAAASAAGEFSLQETGALLARAQVVISGDTGVMHMATAVRTPVVALFGPTVEQFGFFPSGSWSAPPKGCSHRTRSRSRITCVDCRRSRRASAPWPCPPRSGGRSRPPGTTSSPRRPRLRRSCSPSSSPPPATCSDPRRARSSPLPHGPRAYIYKARRKG